MACAINPSREIHAVYSALEIYFDEHERYPDEVDALIGRSDVNRRMLERFTYHTEYDHGTFWMTYIAPRYVMELREPPLCKQSHKAKIMNIADWLETAYLETGSFPEELKPGFMRESFCTEDYDYSASEDLQSFTLDGYAFDAPPPPPEVLGQGREKKIGLLKFIIQSYHWSENRYPKDLEELANSSAPDSIYVDDLIRGENVQYEVSEDGQRAFLEGEELSPSP